MGGFLTVRIETHFPLISPNINFTQIFIISFIISLRASLLVTVEDKEVSSSKSF